MWSQTGERFAAKVVGKHSLKTEKAKSKLFAEINIHRNLRHPNIVRFHSVFEDQQNVYMILELCENRSFAEMVRRRRKLSEAESRFYMVQLLKAISYMHQKRVIHRDLKLGNLFLDANLNVKVGDFGLATEVKFDGERKKTICGTPNYIAPEILFDRENGHSYEVDMWSIGVVLYTFLFGRPPFQTKDVKAIYENIRENRYQFPVDSECSPMVKDLIRNLLAPVAGTRPSIQETMDHPWLQLAIPKSVPVSALHGMPDLSFTALEILSPNSTSPPSAAKALGRKPLTDVNRAVSSPRQVATFKMPAMKSPATRVQAAKRDAVEVQLSPAVSQLRRMAITKDQP